MVYDPILLSNDIEKYVIYMKDSKILRKYYKFRATKFYGGSATGDVVGCNLRCKFCWSWHLNTPSALKNIGFYIDSENAALKLLNIAFEKGFRYIRLSGGEPSIGFEHVFQLLKKIQDLGYSNKIAFILETNGILIGYKKDYAIDLSNYPFIITRVSIKGCSSEEFEAITGADKKFYNYQIEAVKHLIENNIAVSIAITVSFCKKSSLSRLIEQLIRIDENIIDRIELEVVKLYPDVTKRLCKANLFPWIAIDLKNNAILKGDDIEQKCRENSNRNLIKK